MATGKTLTIRREAWLWGISIAGLITLLSAVLVASSIFPARVDAIEDSLETTTHFLSVSMEDYLQQTTELLQVLAQDPEIYSGDIRDGERRKHIALRFLNHVRNREDVIELAAVYESGLVISSSGVRMYPDEETGKWYRDISASALESGARMIPDPDGTLTMIQAAPLFDDTGSRSGNLLARVRTTGIALLLDRDSRYYSQEAFLLDGQGTIRIHRDRSLTGQTVSWAARLRGSQGNLRIREAGQPERMAFYQQIPGTGWTVVSTVECREVLTPIVLTVLRVLITGLVLLLFFFLLIRSVLMNRFVEPLKELVERVETIMGGHRPKDSTRRFINPEIREITGKIQEMTASGFSRKAGELQAILESSGDGFLVTGQNREVTFGNSQFRKMWNYPEDPEQVLEGMDSLDVWNAILSHLENPYDLFRNMNVSYDTPQIFTGSLQTREDRSIDYESLPLTEGHIIRGRVWKFRDVSREKETIRALEEEKALTEGLFRNLPGMVFLLDGSAHMVRWNRRLEEITGYTAEDIRSIPLQEWFLDKEGDSGESFRSLAGHVERNAPFQGELQLPGRAGRMIPMLIMAGPLEMNGQQYYTGVGLDISDQKETRERLTLLWENLKTTLLSVGEAIITTDRQGRVELINAVAENLTGWTREDAVGQPFFEVVQLQDADADRPEEDPSGPVLSGGLLRRSTGNPILISRDGIETRVEYTLSPVRDGDGVILGMVAVFRDFTEKFQERQQIEYLSYHDQLTGLYNRRYFEQALRRLDHATNLPLTIIMGDVNGLKLTNDAFGHSAGDRLLSTVSEVFLKQCREGDIVARTGGDEFMILLPRSTSRAAEKLIQRIRDDLEGRKVENIAVSVSFGSETRTSMEEDIGSIFRRAEDEMYRIKMFEKSGIRSRMIETVLESLFEKSPRERGHSARVAEMSRRLAAALGLGAEEQELMKLAGRCHDIGKVTLDARVLNARTLGETDRAEMLRHPERGYNILTTSAEHAAVAEFVLTHHERLDGSGYPKQLSGQEVSRQAGILAVAEVYDAMTAVDFPGRTLTHNEAAQELRRMSGTLLDTRIVEAFLNDVAEAAE